MKQTVFVFAAVLCVLLAGCGRTAAGETATVPEKTPAPVTASSAPAEESIFPSPSPPARTKPTLLPGQVDIVTADKDKPVREKEEKEKNSNQQAVYQEYAKEMESLATDSGEDVSDQIYVYPLQTLIDLLWPGEDSGTHRRTGFTRLAVIASQIPTEAVRQVDDGLYYTIHDSDNHVRVFTFYSDFENPDEEYERIGYSLFMAQTLSYADFASIRVGSSIEEVEAIDPKIVEVYMGDYKTDEEWFEELKIYAGYGNCRTLHLLRDGILKLTYKVENDALYVSDIYYSEDFILSVCYDDYTYEMRDLRYTIDPLDYAVNLEE